MEIPVQPVKQLICLRSNSISCIIYAKINALYKQRHHFYSQNILGNQNKKKLIFTEISTKSAAYRRAEIQLVCSYVSSLLSQSSYFGRCMEACIIRVSVTWLRNLTCNQGQHSAVTLFIYDM